MPKVDYQTKLRNHFKLKYSNMQKVITIIFPLKLPLRQKKNRLLVFFKYGAEEHLANEVFA